MADPRSDKHASLEKTVKQFRKILDANPRQEAESKTQYAERLAGLLNEAGVQTAKGLPWTGTNCRSFLDRRVADKPYTNTTVESTHIQGSQQPRSTTQRLVDTTHGREGPINRVCNSYTQLPVASTDDDQGVDDDKSGRGTTTQAEQNRVDPELETITEPSVASTQHTVEPSRPKEALQSAPTTQEQVSSTQDEKEPVDKEPETDTQPKVDSTQGVEAMRSLLEDYTKTGGLKDMLSWWSARDKDIQLVQQWPEIEGKRDREVKDKSGNSKGKFRSISSAVYLDVELLQRALEKGQREGARSLSHLVSVLMWHYIGSPPELVKGHRMYNPRTTVTESADKD